MGTSILLLIFNIIYIIILVFLCNLHYYFGLFSKNLTFVNCWGIEVNVHA